MIKCFPKKNEEKNKEEKPSGIGEKFKGIFRKKAETPKTEEIDLEKTEIKVNSNDRPPMNRIFRAKFKMAKMKRGSFAFIL